MLTNVTGIRVWFDGQPIFAQFVAGGQLGFEIHRYPCGALRQWRDQVQGQATYSDTSGRTWHVLRSVAGHNRQPDVVQGVESRIPYHVPVHRPHSADRSEFRLFGGRPTVVVTHRPAHLRSGEYPTVRPRKPVQTQPETETPARPGSPASG